MNIIDRVKEVLEDNYYEKDGDDYYKYEIFVNYDEELGDRSLAKISRADNSIEEMDEIFEEWRSNSVDYYYPELIKLLRKEIEDYEDHEEEITEWVQEHVCWYLPESIYKQEVNVVIALDTGDAEYDFTKCNILNWYGSAWGYVDIDNPIEDESPIKFIAESQGKLDEVKKMIRFELDEYVKKYDDSKFSKFTKSIRRELQNGCSHMLTFVFLLKMPLNEFCELRYQMKEKKGKITIGSETNCGLYNPWSGGGSVLEVELEKDVEVPMDKIWDAWIDCTGCKANGYGYDVCDVYGIWKGVYDYGSYKLSA